MGANKETNLQKCGEILMDINSKNRKTKIYIFHCTFCNLECDQLKKFCIHIGEEHLNNFDDILGETELKFEAEPEEIRLQTFTEVPDIKVFESAISEKNNVNPDPLDTVNPLNTVINHDTLNCEVKNELNEICISEDNCCQEEEKDCIESTGDNYKEKRRKFVTEKLSEDTSFVFDSDSKDYIKDNLDEMPLKKRKQSKKLKQKCIAIEMSSDESKDADSNVEKESNAIKKHKRCKKRWTEKQSENDVCNNKSKRRRRVVETILPILIQQYKKFELLWQVDDIAFGVKNKKYEIYGKIAEEVKLETNKSMSLEDINYHINYVNELYSKDKEQEMKCKMENRDFLPECEHYVKLSFLSKSQGPFLCTICNEILPKYNSYCQHIAQHQNTQPFKCPLCSMMFTNYHKYLIHKKRHLGIYNFHCDICGKGYLFRNDFEWHVTSHTGDKPYLCQICGTGFRARHGYDNHIRRHEERFRYECHICKRGFNQLHALNNHVKSHLNIRDVICKICGKGFVHTKYLKRHELIHGKEKRYKCNECGKAFFQACGLRAHRKNHHSNMLLK